jgi:hypothetical protein
LIHPSRWLEPARGDSFRPNVRKPRRVRSVALFQRSRSAKQIVIHRVRHRTPEPTGERLIFRRSRHARPRLTHVRASSVRAHRVLSAHYLCRSRRSAAAAALSLRVLATSLLFHPNHPKHRLLRAQLFTRHARPRLRRPHLPFPPSLPRLWLVTRPISRPRLRFSSIPIPLPPRRARDRRVVLLPNKPRRVFSLYRVHPPHRINVTRRRSRLERVQRQPRERRRDIRRILCVRLSRA